MIHNHNKRNNIKHNIKHNINKILHKSHNEKAIYNTFQITKAYMMYSNVQ